MLTALRGSTYDSAMEQVQPGNQLPTVGGGTMARAGSAPDRVNAAPRRLESMFDESLQSQKARADDLAERLAKLERQHNELKKVASEVEGRLERAMEYIRSLLAVDQK